MNKKVKQVNYKALLFGALIGGILGLYLYNINLISYILSVKNIFIKFA